MISIYATAVLSGGIIIILWKSIHPTLSVSLGASDGAFGLLAASLVFYYRPATAHFGRSPHIRIILSFILGIGTAVSFLPGVSFVGHLSGLITGAFGGIIVPIIRSKESIGFDDSN